MPTVPTLTSNVWVALRPAGPNSELRSKAVTLMVAAPTNATSLTFATGTTVIVFPLVETRMLGLSLVAERVILSPSSVFGVIPPV